MSGLIARIGLRAIGGTLLSGVGAGIKSAGKWLGSLDLVHLCLLIAVLFGGWQTFGRWSQHRHDVKVEDQLSKATLALTATRNDLATSKANEATLWAEVTKQNNQVKALGAKSAAQHEVGTKAANLAQERARSAEAVRDQLAASARSSSGKSAVAANCEPSDALKAHWKG